MALVELAVGAVGTPYVFGGADSDFDCSALVRASMHTVAAADAAEGEEPWQPVLVTVPNVELIEVGEEWETSTGVFDFTPEDLVSAIESQDDPAIRTPVLKLGHVDPRFDGQPSFGRIENLQITNNGNTLLGDLVAVPQWLAAIMASAYPRRSIEGGFETTTRTGNTWSFVLTGLALLGDAYPAIDTLEDMKALFGAQQPVLYPVEDVEEIAASGAFFRARKVDDMPNWLRRNGGGRTEVAAARAVRASVNLDDVRRAYYETLDGAQYWWWIREVRVNPFQLVVDDDEGSLYLVDVTVDDADAITFGDPVEVKIQYVAAGSGKQKGQVIAGAWNTAVESGRPERDPEDVAAGGKPSTGTPADKRLKENKPKVTKATGSTADPEPPDGDAHGTEGQGTMTPEQLAAIGLPADATDEQIMAKLTTLGATAQGGDGNVGEGDGDGTGTPGGGTPGGTGQPTTPATAPDAAPTTTPATGEPGGGEGGGTTEELKLPPGTVLMDEATLNELKQGVAASSALVKKAAEEDRERVLAAAVKAGKFPRARLDHWRTAWAEDPEGTRETIEKTLKAGLVPVEETGRVGESDGGGTGEEGPAYPDSWKKSVAATRRGMGDRVKVVND